jgi:hypothetical protein
MSRAATAIVLALVATTTAEARAPRAGAAEHAAAEHVAAANRAFQAGSYDAALAQLRIAYQLAPRPEFLLTFAQIYRAAGQLGPALEACNSYLAMVPDGPMVAGAKKLAEMLKTEIAARAPAPPPPQPSHEPAPPPMTLTPSAPAIATPAPATTTEADASRRRRRRLGVALAITGGAVVVGLAVGLGVGLTVGQRHSTYGPIVFTPMP